MILCFVINSLYLQSISKRKTGKTETKIQQKQTIPLYQWLRRKKNGSLGLSSFIMDPTDQSPGPDFTGVVDSVMHLFGEVMSRDAICAVVEHCGGDLTQAIDIIVNMSEDSPVNELTNTTLITSDQTAETTNIVTPGSLSVPRNAQNTKTMQKSPPRISYAGASQTKGALPKQPPKQKETNIQSNIWTLQTRQIVAYHNQGSRTLVLMRGLPGSGKSYLAKTLVETMCPGLNYKTFIFTTDDYFTYRGQYHYNKTMLPEAHSWNQNRVREAIGRGVSPIFVDNTNVELWHMEPYVRVGVQNGYIIEVLEPDTPWAKKVGQLARKNSHEVSIQTLRRLLDSFQNGISGVYLIRSFGLSYPADKVPPVMRNYPPIVPIYYQQDQQIQPTPVQAHQSQASPQIFSDDTATVVQSDTSVLNPCIPQQDAPLMSNTDGTSHSTFVFSNQAGTSSIETNPFLNQANVSTHQYSSTDLNSEEPVRNEQETSNMISSIDINATSNDTKILPDEVKDPVHKVKFVKLDDVRKQLDEIEKLEEEWENGDAWNDDSKKAGKLPPLIENASAFNPKPPRNATDSDTFLPSDSNYNDWSKISMFMPSWNDSQHTSLLDTPNVTVETATKATSVEFGDTDINNTNQKVLISTPRDINFYYMGLNEEKIPDKRMLDKSSMTNEHNHIALETVRCKNEEKHFIAFRKLFKNISKVELRDIFDKCVGDVNWAVDIVLDGMANDQLHTVRSDDISDTEDVGDEQCDCLAAYNVIPNINIQTKASPAISDPNSSEAASGSSVLPGTPKLKKEKNLSESSIQLKRQIEQNVVISDIHYSDHCLKIRKMRRGEVSDGQGDQVKEEADDICIASTSSAAAAEPAESFASTDDEDSQTTVSDEGEKFVNVDLGPVFVTELDNLFGRNDMMYPANIVNRVNMPLSLLNEINALWIESLTYQLDQQARQSEMMLRQDEDFARQLALKEEQLAQAGQEPAVPDLKDIMDMELALYIYKKEITAEWRNNEPNDLAARMTREKLYNLFPDVSPEILSELLMAHDNNFQATVEVLLSSTGNAQILEEENGVAKFITKKELERHEKLIEEQKKALSEVEWPLLPKDVKVNMDTVQEYRAKADQHRKQRHMYRLRAESYLNRNMPQIASYYSDVAVLHKKKFDQANSLAAASLMQVHAANCTDNATLDLHFLRVLEAKESLDLFLDTHIRKLREPHSRGGPKFHTLFFITGRGLHSHGGPKVKPATKRRLRERGIAYTERNPGLLSSRVAAEDKLTHEIP